MSPLTPQLAAQLGDELLQRGLKVTCAESCTGGGVARAITDIAGSSGWFEFGFVSYANKAKQQLLGVSAEALETEGAVSEVIVKQMARGALEASGADIAVAISGIAGPDGGSAEKPVGTVWFCWATKSALQTSCEVFTGDRAAVRSAAVEKSLQGLLDILKK